MTVLDEISACPVANREFWTQAARLSIVIYREQRDQNGRGHAFTRQYRIGFRQNMASRRTQRYLGA